MPYPAKISRDRILAEAIAQLEQEGPARLSLRTLAAELGVAPNALYRYFADRSALEAALADASTERLQAALERAAQPRGTARRTPGESIRAMGQAYLRFAREHPHLYEVMMGPGCHDEGPGPHRALWEFVLAQVARLTGEQPAPEAAVALWALLHGTAALERAGVFTAQKPFQGFLCGLNMWIEGAERKFGEQAAPTRPAQKKAPRKRS